MNFLQVKDGISVRKSDIIAIERMEDGGTKVLTMNTMYECPFLYESILTLLEMEDLEEKVASNPQQQPFAGMWGTQHWRG